MLRACCKNVARRRAVFLRVDYRICCIDRGKIEPHPFGREAMRSARPDTRTSWVRMNQGAEMDLELFRCALAEVMYNAEIILPLNHRGGSK